MQLPRSYVLYSELDLLSSPDDFLFTKLSSIFAFNSHSALLDQANYLFVPSNLMLFGINSIS